MRDKAHFFNFFDTKYLIVSIFLHLFIFTLFTFRFTPQFIDTRPRLVFLGSFLKTDETSGFFQKSFQNAGIFAEPVTLQFRQNERSRWPVDVEKPSASKSYTTPSKIWLKSTFDLQETQKAIRTKQIQLDLGIDLEAPLYEPLRMKKDDFR